MRKLGIAFWQETCAALCRNIAVVAGKEFRDGLRNRWVLAITLLFAVFALGLGYFGSAAGGTLGFASLDTTIVSLSSLAIFVIPLIALLLAYDTLVGEEEQGTLLLLLSYPLSRTQLLLGKFFGHGLVLGLATLLGFGGAGAVIALLTGRFLDAQLWAVLGLFILSVLLLGLVFIALACLISVSSREKSRAAGAALLVWFVFVLVFDLSLLALLVATEGRIGQAVLPYLMLLNPCNAFRLLNLTGFEATQAYAGLVSIAQRELFSPGVLISVLLAWIVLPFSLAAWLFRRRHTV
jgi:Cu-processing system permease protein